MHVAAAAPLALTPEHLSKDIVERERAVQADIARQSGKPENVIEKMMEGRMRKFYEESVLMSQTFVIDGETSIAKVLEKASKDLGAPVDDRWLRALPGRRGHREDRQRLRGRSQQNGRELIPRRPRCRPRRNTPGSC